VQARRSARSRNTRKGGERSDYGAVPVERWKQERDIPLLLFRAQTPSAASRHLDPMEAVVGPGWCSRPVPHTIVGLTSAVRVAARRGGPQPHRGADHGEGSRWVGLDVHARSVLAVSIDGETWRVELATTCRGSPQRWWSSAPRCPARHGWPTKRADGIRLFADADPGGMAVWSAAPGKMSGIRRQGP